MAMITRRGAMAAMLPVAWMRGAARPARFEEVRRFAAAEANQAVAADGDFLFAIDNHAVGQYDKRSGKRVAGWRCEAAKPLIHLDSGVVRGGTLYCAHSNYPGVPMTSSIEMWDARTLRHSGSFSFGIYAGSATWVDFRGASRFVTFAHYRGKNDEADRDPHWTALVEFDSEWRQRQSWVYPEEVVARLRNMSVSGGVFTPEGKLWCTGHDNAEVYVLGFPEGGSALVLEDIIPAPFHGQGIALDPVDRQLLYGIDRKTREIVISRLQTA
jgi:hypothetical protein